MKILISSCVAPPKGTRNAVEMIISTILCPIFTQNPKLYEGIFNLNSVNRLHHHVKDKDQVEKKEANMEHLVHHQVFDL